MINKKNKYKQQSLPLELRESFERHDFIVGKSNLEAIKWIDKYPDWEEPGLIIIGPNSSGKSHLASVLQLKSNWIIKHSENINNEDKDCLMPCNIIIENIEKISNFIFFLHVINFIKENKFKIFLTSRKNLKDIDIDLLDLKSRLLAFPQANILMPTDDVLMGIILKLSKDKGLKLNSTIINFILNHSERSYKSINSLMKSIDIVTLQRKVKITIPLIKELLDLKKFN